MGFRRTCIAVAIATGLAAACGGDSTPPGDAVGGDSDAGAPDADDGASDFRSDGSDVVCDPHACVLWCLSPSSAGSGACLAGLCSCEACDPEGCGWYCSTHPPGASGTCEADGSCLCG